MAENSPNDLPAHMALLSLQNQAEQRDQRPQLLVQEEVPPDVNREQVPLTPLLPAMIEIPYRIDGKQAGAGAYFDHQTMRLATGHPTCICTTLKAIDVEHNLQNYMKTTIRQLKLLEPDKVPHIYPTKPTDYTSQPDVGLLYIPGRATAKVKDPRELDQSAIKYALLRGRPILAVCAGAELLWKQHLCAKDARCNAWKLLQDGYRQVKDHATEMMPRFNLSSDVVGNNILVHEIQVKDDSLLDAAMRPRRIDENPPNPNRRYKSFWQRSAFREYPVNSVHNTAPNHSIHCTSGEFVVSAWSVVTGSVEFKGMQTESDSVEAFESARGAPVLGVMWHPEAMANNFPSEETKENLMKKQRPVHQALLQYLTLAGDAWAAKQRMLACFKVWAKEFEAWAENRRMRVEAKLFMTNYIQELFV